MMGMTPEQLSAAAVYFDSTSKMSHKQKLQAAGITELRWRGWMKEPAFARYVGEIGESILREAQPVALVRIAESIDKGERWAIELGLEITGRHDRREKSVDINQLLMGIFGILDDEVGDPKVLAKIAEKVKLMIGGGAPVMQITPAEMQQQPIEGT